MKSVKKLIKGFTILELLVAIVILGIIITLAVIVIDRYIIQGHNEVNKQLSNQLVLAAKNYYNENKNSLVFDDGLIIWYTTLKSNNYMTNDLVDSKGNSCSKSYVVVSKQRDKYVYTGCVTCDNGGYNNTSASKLCTESFNNNITCSWEKKNNVLLGMKEGKNSVELNLTCSGKNLSYSNNKTALDNSMFSAVSGRAEVIKQDKVEKNKTTITAVVKYTATDSNAKNGSVTFNEGSVLATGRKGEIISNDDTLYDGILIDGNGPSCSLSGPYKDKELTTSVKAVKSGTKVYYKLNCEDEHAISGSVETTGFESSSSIDSLKLEKPSGEDSNKRSALVEVTVVKGTSSKLTLAYKENELFDTLENGNDRAVSKINGSESVLVIDDQAPTCVFSGPASDINMTYYKTKMSISLSPTDYVYYSLKCSDENDIEDRFNINQITNNGFSNVEYVKTNDVILGTHIGYEYIIKAYATSYEGTGYLTYNTNNALDKVGNYGVNSVIRSSSVTMYDPSKIPECSISINYASDYRSATLTGYMSDNSGLNGYSWSDNYGEPSSYSYISGTSNSVSNSVSLNGWYYLHMRNVNNLTGYCLAYVTQIKPAPPNTPTLKASDSIASGKWHTSSYSLEASGSGSNVVYYYGTSPSNITSTSKPSITSETTGDIYYAKACRAEDSTNCSDYVSYNALLDTNAPKCNLYFTTDNYKSSGGSATYYTSTETEQVYVELSCSDSVSGLGSTSLYKDGTATGYSTRMKLTTAGTYVIKAIASDKAGNVMTGSNHTVKITKKITCGAWSSSSAYVSSCTPSGSSSGTSTKYVTCESGYSKKTTYTGSCTKSTCKWGSGTATTSTTDPNGNLTYKPSNSCTYTGQVGYSDKKCTSCVRGGTSYAPSCSTPANNRCNKWSYNKYTCSCSGCSAYGSYKAGTSTYTKSCSSSGTKGSTASYTTCESGYSKKTTYTRTCS